MYKSVWSKQVTEMKSYLSLFSLGLSPLLAIFYAATTTNTTKNYKSLRLRLIFIYKAVYGQHFHCFEVKFTQLLEYMRFPHHITWP